MGLLSSALEHAVPEQLFTTDPNNPVQGVSAVKALQLASQQGQRIYHITPANAAITLPNINIGSEAKREISSALNMGREVITHTNNISVPGWTGAGYIMVEPDSGQGAFKITGGSNGGWLYILTIAILLFVVAFWLIAFMAGGGILVLISLIVSIVNYFFYLKQVESSDDVDASSLTAWLKAFLGMAPVSKMLEAREKVLALMTSVWISLINSVM